ncbi:collagen-like triple helix repeat-containing protein [Flavobacterium johnsoniae]|uniref:collagen-like triple helix repeat-containing protein n=1 Tax=Flavobacterium johnsoniae TaxID=986 RepID=UPI001F6018E7|nr:collagen-like protein [Flavobacterium johnsoniae]
MIPRISLTSTIDTTTIISGNVNSLLVFNTQTIADITPGYYYWYVNKWYRMGSGTETITTLVDNGNGTITYTNESGVPVTVKVPKGDKGDAGVVGVEGMPGTSGMPGIPGSGAAGDPGAGTTIVTNDSGTWVYNPTANTWTNIKGPKGDTGVAGPQGIQGIQGLKGDVGEAGPTGAPGVAGDTGPTGVPGIAGQTGPQGPAGPQGIQGLTGPIGPIGPAGTSTPQTITHTLNSSGNILTSTVNSESPTASIINTNVLSLNSNNELVSTINGVASTGTVSLTATEVDGVIGNEVTNATINGGLIRAGTGTLANPYTLGFTPGISNGDMMIWDGTTSAWAPKPAQNIYTANGSLNSARTLTHNSYPLTFEGSLERTIFSSGGTLSHEGITGAANFSLISADLDTNGAKSRLIIQAFSENVVNVTAYGDTRGLNFITNNNTTSAPIKFMTTPGGSANNAEDRMIITGEGNIGIGTDAPLEKLDIHDGNVSIRTINLNAGSAADKIVVADADGVLKTVNAVMPKFFYMPSIVFNVSTITAGLTKDLHQEYVNQFGTPQVSSSGASGSIPTLDATALEYYITYYDTALFENVSIDANGVLTYDVKSTNTTGYSFMNIVFSIK